MSNLNQLINQAEIAREKNKPLSALTLLDEAIWKAGAAKKYNLLLDALGHKIVIWLNRWQATQDESYLELMAASARAGFEIGLQKKVDKGWLSIMLLRLGHYHLYKKEYLEAAEFFKAALAGVGKKDLGKYAEYLGFYGTALSLARDKKGIGILTEALHMARAAKDLRLFHKMIVESGILIRLGLCAYAFNDKKFFKACFDEAEDLAKILKRDHGMPQRLDQIRMLRKNPRMLI
jgi:hypothetical protein